MLRKRLIAVVTVRDGWAVQSFGYRSYLPLGSPECLVENLDRWGADEILLQVIDRSSLGVAPDFGLLGRIGRLGLRTPLIYAGGIRTVSDGVRAIQSGADRLVVDALFHDDPSTVKALAERLGAQALIGSMPLSRENDRLHWLNYRNRHSSAIPPQLLESIGSAFVSEVLVIDWTREGQPGGFDPSLVELFPVQDIGLIAFGGLSLPEQMSSLLQRPNVSAIAIGNFLNYREHAIQRLRESLTGLPIRNSHYEARHSILGDV